MPNFAIARPAKPIVKTKVYYPNGDVRVIVRETDKRGVVKRRSTVIVRNG